jgi:uncharacterized OsmC-like protein
MRRTDAAKAFGTRDAFTFATPALRRSPLAYAFSEEGNPMSVSPDIVLTGCLAPEPNTAPTGCLTPIDKAGLDGLIAAGKANPQVIKTLKCKTVAEGRFRHANYIRSLPPYIVDEPPALLGDDTAPNPSEASLAALGSCLAVGLHANAVHRGWIVRKLELQLEGDLNITGVWGTGDMSEKPVGFTDVRVKVEMECDGIAQSEIDALITHVKKWSPVANTFTRPVNLELSL